MRVRFAMGLIVATTACGPPELVGGPPPEIAIDVCAEQPVELNGVVVGGAAACALDFGDVDISVLARRSFTITNVGTFTLLDLSSAGTIGPRLLAAPDSGLVMANVPATIEPGRSAEIAVDVRPRRAGVIDAAVLVSSNASNATEIRIPIVLTGVDNGIPDIEVAFEGCALRNPLAIDFASVDVGATAACTVVVRNTGTRELSVLDVSLVGRPTFTLAPDVDGVFDAVDVGAELRFGLTFAPQQARLFEGELAVVSSDPDEPTVVVRMHGFGR